MRVYVDLPLAGRDLRLDLFRGLANWAIFLDHIPHEVLSSITTRNYGFSDAADLFVFISGYTAAFVFGRVMIERGYVAAMSKLARRASELYIAHIIVVAIYIALVAWVCAHAAIEVSLNSIWVQILAGSIGLLVMTASAYYWTWSKQRGRMLHLQARLGGIA